MQIAIEIVFYFCGNIFKEVKHSINTGSVFAVRPRIDWSNVKLLDFNLVKRKKTVFSYLVAFV